jgi:hypothetical protein
VTVSELILVILPLAILIPEIETEGVVVKPVPVMVTTEPVVTLVGETSVIV